MLYTFNDPQKAQQLNTEESMLKIHQPTAFVDPRFQAFYGNDTITTLFLETDTSTDNATDRIQIL